MNRSINTALALLLLLPALALGHGGEDHGDHEDAAPAATPAADGELLSAFGTSERFELLLKYPVAEAKSPARLRVYLSDYASNRPIEGASFVLASRPAGVVAKEPPHMISPGIYEMTAVFPHDTVYNLTATIVAGASSDAVTLEHVYAGEAAERFLVDHAPAGSAPAAKSGFPWWIPVAALAALAVVAIALLAGRRSRGRETVPMRKKRDDDHAVNTTSDRRIGQ